jgi:gliding motility associated protien GldN
MKRLGFALVLATSTLALQAQEGLGEDEGYNKYSTKHIHESDIMYQKSVVRAVDLREKQNKPLFARDQEITKLLLDAVKEGVITPYSSDSLDEGRVLTLDEFNTAIKIAGVAPVVEEEEFAAPATDEWGSAPAKTETPVAVEAPSYEYRARDLYQLEINEDVLFDKQRSVLFYDIQSITMYVPADQADNIKGFQYAVCTFKYKELVEKVFKDNPKAIWFNPYNDKEHRNLADAFELRLFSSYLVKISNPSDEYIEETYGGDPRTGIMASQWKAFEMLEYEHNLWEF